MKKLSLTLTFILLLASMAFAQQVSPAANSVLMNTPQPTISASFNEPVRNLRVTVDGRDFTANAHLSGNSFTLVPPYPLDFGVHTVNVEALNLIGIPQRANWTFTLANGNQNPNGNQGNQNNQGNQGQSARPTAVFPADRSESRQSRPAISADFPEPVNSLRFSVDDVEMQNETMQGNRGLANLSQDLAPGQHTVKVRARGQSGNNYRETWTFQVRQRRQQNLNIVNQGPGPGTIVTVTRPTISADFPEQANNARILVDGQDQTNQAQRSNQRIALNPSYDLSNGQHTVVVEGTNARGQMMTSTWNFQVNAQQVPVPPPTAQLTVQEPLPNSPVGNNFDVVGQARPRAVLSVVVRGHKTQSFRGSADRTGYFEIPVKLKGAPRGVPLTIQVTELDRRTGRPVGRPYNLQVVRR